MTGDAQIRPEESLPPVEVARERRPWWLRALIGIGTALVVLAVAGVVLYRFGSMWVPSAETRAAYDGLRAAGEAPAIERQFHIPIPGCVCHSDDPVLTMQHSNRRISQCMGCHGS